MSKKNSRAELWDENKKHIYSLYSHLEGVELNKDLFFQDPAFMARIINDILKYDSSSSSSGKRPPLTPDRAKSELLAFIGEDYSLEPFVETFKRLKSDKSVRLVAGLTGLDKSMVQLLLQGKKKPTIEILEKIASGFGKKPDFFLEYRIAYLFFVLQDRLVYNPESSIVFYEKVK